MASEQERPLDRLKQEEDKRKYITTLKNQFLTLKLERLQLLKRHYEDFWLDLDLKDYESKLDSIVSRTKATVYHISRKKIEELKTKYEREDKQLDEQLAKAQAKLDKFNSLDSNLLAEYRKIRDDIECQNLLVEISKNNAQN